MPLDTRGFFSETPKPIEFRRTIRQSKGIGLDLSNPGAIQGFRGMWASLRRLPERDDLRPLPETVQVVSPCLHHPFPLGEVLCIVVGRPDLVALRMGKLSLDRAPVPALLPQRVLAIPRQWLNLPKDSKGLSGKRLDMFLPHVLRQER